MGETRTPLALWLEEQMAGLSLSQRVLAERSGVALGTINKVLKSGYVPKIETLFRLGESLGADRVEMLIVAGHLTPADQFPRGDVSYGPGADEDSRLEWQLIREFRQVPAEWKYDALDQMRLFVRLAARRRTAEPSDTEAYREP